MCACLSKTEDECSHAITQAVKEHDPSSEGGLGKQVK